MRIKNVIIGIMFLICLMSSVFAVTQPSQQYSKIFVSPFYTASMTKDVNYSFSLNIVTPDNIGMVLSSLVSFQTYPTSAPQEYFLYVNGQPCNNPSYSATEKGMTFVMFDCSNRVVNEGSYVLTLYSDKDSGSVVGWSDFTYINNPLGELDVSGTEYSPNKSATIFLQLKDSQGLPVSDGACYLDVYNPLINATHSLYLDDAPMLLAVGGNGMYYYDLTTPSVLGVYMLSASCSYTYGGGYVYELDEVVNYPNRTGVYGTYTGSPSSLNDYDDGLYTKCDYQLVTGQKVCEAYYDFNTTIHFSNMTNVTNMDLYYMGETYLGATGIFYVWNWTDGTWITLPNSLTYSGSASSTAPLGINDYVSNSLPVNETINSTTGIIRVRHYVSSTGVFTLYNNWLNIKILTAEGIIQDIKGSSEMHVTNIPQDTANLVQNLTLNVNSTQVWEYENRSLTDTGNIVSAVWNWTGGISSSILDFFSNAIWTFTDRNLTYYEDVTNYSQVAEYVWYYGDRNLTFYEVNDISPEEIWNYTSRNLTFTEDVTNYSQVAEYVWLYVERNLTTEYINNLSSDEIWNYYNRSLTQDIPLQIWSYPERNLTTDIPFEVWSYYNRTLTYYTLNLSELIDMINDYEFDEAIIPFSVPTDTYQSSVLNVTLYIVK